MKIVEEKRDAENNLEHLECGGADVCVRLRGEGGLHVSKSPTRRTPFHGQCRRRFPRGSTHLYAWRGMKNVCENKMTSLVISHLCFLS